MVGKKGRFDEEGENGGGKGRKGGPDELSDLIAEVKDMQRNQEGFREAWQEYCVLYGGSKLDPSRHDAQFIKKALSTIGKGKGKGKGVAAFFHSSARGSRLPNDPVELIAMVKERQRTLPGWKNAWWHYCDVNGGGDKDPSRHDVPYLKRALRILSIPSDEDMEGGKGAEMFYPQDRGSYGKGGGMVYATGGGMSLTPQEVERQSLIAEVKNRQKNMAGFRQYWIEYCHSNGVGGMDPGRHNIEFLRRGLLPPAENHQELVQTIKNFQRSDSGFKAEWVAYCTQHGMGVRDPTRHSLEFLTYALRELVGGKGLRGVTVRPHRGASALPLDLSHPHMELVATVKRIQKESQDARQRWIDFCGRWGSSDLDPARHDAEFLQRAISFMQSEGPASSQGDDMRMGRLRNVLGYDAGHGSKDVLVAAVKRGQRASDGWRERWWDYCDKRANGDHDPARYSVQFLQEALKELGEP